MIYITGDIHGDKRRFTTDFLPDLSDNDYLIICGDFGFLFNDNQEEYNYLDYLETLPFTICFIDGNHENFNALYGYPVENWKGGQIHKIRKNVFHLMRGQIFTIENKKIFTMGGAYSIDRASNKYWVEELPSSEEYRTAIENLKGNNNKVDIIITHTAPREIIMRMNVYPDCHDAELTGFLEWVMHEIDFNNWYFGHWHTDEEILPDITAVYTAVHTQ